MDSLLHPTDLASRPKAPRAEDLELRFSETAVAQLEEIKSHYPNLKAAMLPALWIAQREYGGQLTDAAMAEVALRLERSYAEVQGVATFYSMYNVHHKPGRHKIELCTCLSCHVNGAYRLRDWVKAKLGIEHGETTADGLFTYEEVECLNACDRAPVVQIADAYHGPVDEASLAKLIEELQAVEESTVVQLADEIVKVHVQGAAASGEAAATKVPRKAKEAQ
jgi:NADH-quinone oxidoreductase subunit E